MAKTITNTTFTTNIHLQDFKRYSTSWTHYNQTTPTHHTNQGKTEHKIIITLQTITIPTNYKNIQFDHSIQNPISSIQFQHSNTFTSTNIVLVCPRSITCPRSIAGVPMSQAAPVYLITRTPPVCVPDVIGALTVRRLSKKKEKGRQQNPDQLNGTRTFTFLLFCHPCQLLSFLGFEDPT